ncbi:MAG: glycine hydroxymethyltransferase [Chlamydiota bacterium]
MSYLDHYLDTTPKEKRAKAAIAYLATLDHLNEDHPEVAAAIAAELKDQRRFLKLIASENYSSLTSQLAMGNLLTDKYSEGFIRHRFYAGCDNVDAVEELAIQELKQLYDVDHAYVQPHSGADANLIAFWAILVQRIQNKELEVLGKKSIETLTPEEYERIRQLLVNQKVMGMGLSSGGHLTHGYRHNVSAKMMRAVSYEVDPVTEEIDYQALARQVKQEQPMILIGGYSSYPRLINCAKMREIADLVGAVFVVDMAHFSGLVAGKVITGDYDPIPFAHVITSTTHKTLRGPRGGMILCQREFKEVVDKGCPLVIGGPMPHVIAAKAVAFREANTPAFRDYAAQIVANARALANALLARGAKLFTGGTDNHLLVIDVESSFQLTGRQAELALYEAMMTVSRNAIPFDPNGPWYTSGVRMGTAALTTLGMREKEMSVIGDLIVDLLQATRAQSIKETGKTSRARTIIEPKTLARVKAAVHSLLTDFPLYPELVVDSPLQMTQLLEEK